MSPHFGGGSAFYLVDGSPPPARRGPDPVLELRLAGHTTRRSGQPLELSLSFENRSRGPLVVLRPLDGSLEHLREPHYDLYLRDEGDGAVYRWAFVGGRCGNVNPITADDLVALAPGESRDDVINGWARHLRRASIARPGRYSAWVVYRSCGDHTHGLALGPDAPTASVHLGQHVSNPVRFEVR
jgi:hypothetical protein